MISYLEKHSLDTEGILRVPGSASRVNSLLQDLEASFHMGQFSFSGIKETDICSLLKQFIRFVCCVYVSGSVRCVYVHVCLCACVFIM